MRAMPLQAVMDAFSLAVCVGAEYQPMRGSEAAGAVGSMGFDPHKRFAEAYKLPEANATRLMSASFAGSAFATPGAAFP
jgi:hypothetical protein